MTALSSETPSVEDILSSGFHGVIAAIRGLTVRSEQEERSIVRELRLVNARLDHMDSSLNGRLEGIDDKLTDIREHVTRVEERTL